MKKSVPIAVYIYIHHCGMFGTPAPELKKEIEFELVGREKLSSKFWETNTNEIAQRHAGYWSDEVKRGLLDDLRNKRITSANLLTIHDDVINLSKKYISKFSSENKVGPVLSISAPSSNAYQFFRRNWLPITTTIAGITAAIEVFRRNSQ